MSYPSPLHISSQQANWRPSRRRPVPDAQAQQTAKKAAGGLFAERFTKAKTTTEKTALATDMMDAAGKVQAGSADQYILLKIARDVAAGIGDAATALQAVERLLEQFDESAAELIGDTLLTAARQATTSAQHEAVAEAALSITGIRASNCSRGRFAHDV